MQILEFQVKIVIPNWHPNRSLPVTRAARHNGVIYWSHTHLIATSWTTCFGRFSQGVLKDELPRCVVICQDFELNNSNPLAFWMGWHVLKGKVVLLKRLCY